MISGKPVIADTSVTSMPSPRSSLPCRRRQQRDPRLVSSRASSSRPSLFETLSSARRIGMSSRRSSSARGAAAGGAASAASAVDL
jgi:hypothetical protein